MNVDTKFTTIIGNYRLIEIVARLNGDPDPTTPYSRWAWHITWQDTLNKNLAILEFWDGNQIDQSPLAIGSRKIICTLADELLSQRLTHSQVEIERGSFWAMADEGVESYMVECALKDGALTWYIVPEMDGARYPEIEALLQAMERES
jgi:hypothetical protein